MTKIIIILFLITLTSTTNLRFVEEVNSPPETKDKIKGWAHIDLLSKVAQIIESDWDDIVKKFKTNNSLIIKELIKSSNLETFYGKFKIMTCEGLKIQYYNEFFTKKTNNNFGVKNNQVHLFIEAIQDAKNLESNNIWGNLNIIFNPIDYKDGSVIGVNILINKPDNNFNVIITLNNAKFKLEPDILVEETSKSVNGSIFKNSNYHLMKVPKSLSEDKVKAVLNMYQLISFKMICEIFGIKVDLPKI